MGVELNDVGLKGVRLICVRLKAPHCRTIELVLLPYDWIGAERVDENEAKPLCKRRSPPSE